jgi:putative FmdB family regulatory protein
MPLYTYKCLSCGHEFDDLMKYDNRDNPTSCKVCEGKSERVAATRFGIATTLNPRTDTIYTPKEIDKVVGKAAEEKWSGYDERWRKRYTARQKERWGDKTPGEVSIPKDADGKYSPIMHLGNAEERSIRKEASEALQEHRKERVKKGIGQFDGPGSF